MSEWMSTPDAFAKQLFDGNVNTFYRLYATKCVHCGKYVIHWTKKEAKK